MSKNEILAVLRHNLHDLESEDIGEYDNPVAEGYARCIQDLKKLWKEDEPSKKGGKQHENRHIH